MYTGFWIEKACGNNAFSFKKREQILKRTPRIYVPPLLSVSAIDLKLGTEIAFEEVDENNILQSMNGLENFLSFSFINSKGRRIPVVVFDNHNHAFFFWHEALFQKKISEYSKLIHIDAHTDLNEPSHFLPAERKNDLQAVFEYTNNVLNVGNFILPAIRSGCIDPEIIMINTEMALKKNSSDQIAPQKHQSIILDIDLDFWDPELLDISTEKGVASTRLWLERADLVTVATSPFFTSQARAIETLEKIFSDVKLMT